MPSPQVGYQNAAAAQPTFKNRALQALHDLGSPEGLATGAGAAFVFGGPIGIALGLAQGILARRQHQSELDAQAQEQAMLGQLDQLQAEGIKQVQGLAATDIDKAQLAQVARDYQMLRRQSMSPDPQTRQAAIAKLADFGPNIGAWLEDLEGRNETVLDKNVAVMDEQAGVARQDYQDALKRDQDVTRISSEMHQLLSDPNFDVNQMLNRARLGQLLDQTPREFFADPADMADALKDVGGNLPGILGAIPAWIAGKQKAEDFKWSKEDWRKVAYAMTVASKKQSQRQLQDAMNAGKLLDETSQRIGHVPALSYLDRIVTGKTQDTETVSGQRNIYNELEADARAKEQAAQKGAATASESAHGRVASILEKTKDVAANALKSTVQDALGAVGIHIKTPEERAAERKKKRPTNGATGAY